MFTFQQTSLSLIESELNDGPLYNVCNNRPNNNVSGKIVFQKTGKTHHVVLASARFDRNNREINGPLPGWFVQIVGSNITLAWGTGKKWTSCSGGTITLNKDHEFVFDINNNTKVVTVWLDGVQSSQSNIVFKHATNDVIIGALNTRPEFQFDGILKSVVIGEDVQLTESLPPTDITHDQISTLVDQLRQNIQNIQKDMNALENIELLIEGWRTRGVNISSTTILEQKQSYESRLLLFMTTISTYTDSIKYKEMEVDNGETSLTQNGDQLDVLSTSLNGLFDDILLIQDAIKTLRHYSSIGIRLGNVNEAVDKQITSIQDSLNDAGRQLTHWIQETDELKNEIIESY